jgi:hypothetical protein
VSGDHPFIGHLTLNPLDQVFRGQVWQNPPLPSLVWPSGNRRYWKSDMIAGQRLRFVFPVGLLLSPLSPTF